MKNIKMNYGKEIKEVKECKILNIWGSPHDITDEQKSELKGDLIHLRDVSKSLFETISSLKEDTDIETVVSEMAVIVEAYKAHYENVYFIQPAGHQLLMCYLGLNHIPCKFAFSERVSEDKVMDDGSIRKISVFKHKCFMTIE